MEEVRPHVASLLAPDTAVVWAFYWAGHAMFSRSLIGQPVHSFMFTIQIFVLFTSTLLSLHVFLKNHHGKGYPCSNVTEPS